MKSKISRTKNALILGYENSYLIYEDGRVFGVFSNKFLKPVVNNCGYMTVNLYKKGKARRHTIHRLLATAFIHNTENLPVINHKDGNKSNNSLENLEWISRSGNSLHAIRLGLTPPPHNKGIPMTDAAKQKLSAALKGRKSPCGMLGKTMSQKSRQKISESNKGVSRNRGKIAYQYPIIQLTMEGAAVRCWENAKTASVELNISNGNIVSCLKGKRNKSGGFRWEYQK